MYEIISGKDSFEIKLASEKKAELNGQIREIDIAGENGCFHVIQDHKGYLLEVISADYKVKLFTIKVNNNIYTLEVKDKFDFLLEKLGMENLSMPALNNLKSPMPGLVLSIEVTPGQMVKKGDSLLVLEAMKMENVLKAFSNGIVKKVLAESGKIVEKNQTLIEFQ